MRKVTGTWGVQVGNKVRWVVDRQAGTGVLVRLNTKGDCLIRRDDNGEDISVPFESISRVALPKRLR